MNYKEAVAYILDIPRFTAKNSLVHAKAFMARLGEPAAGAKVIHVAGTNGKGSVCSFLRALLLAEDKSVGLFTSPHLVTLNERIQIGSAAVSNEEFLECFQTVYKVVCQMKCEGIPHPTFFEFLFGMAMVAFERAGVTYVILETGLGGRLDATNSIENPVLCVLTSISVDHTELLGETLTEIAGEKAGIIKPGVCVLFQDSGPEVSAVIERRAGEKSARCRKISKNAHEITEIDDKYIAFLSMNAYYESITWKIKHTGIYQVENAILALEAFAELMPDGNKRFVKWGQALASASWPSRMEEVSPGVILDGAHNVGAIQAFSESVKRSAAIRNKKSIILFAVSADKQYEEMIRILCKNVMAEAYVVTAADQMRGTDISVLDDVFRRYTGKMVVAEADAYAAFQKAMRLKGEDGCLYCLGSLYLTGKIEKWIQEV